MKFYKINFNKGFSVVEIIIYLAIFTAISILVINSFIIILSTFSTIRTNHDLLNSGNNSMERISREIRQAKNIDIVNSSFDSDSSVLRLNDTDGTSYVVFDKNENNLRISRNNIEIGNLLTQNVLLIKLIFRRISTTNSEAIKIEMELQNTNGKIIKTDKFYNTVVLRGGY